MGSISNRCMENWIQSTMSAFSHFDLSNLENNIFILSSQKQWFLYICYQKHLVCWGYVAMLLTVKLRPYSEHYPQYWRRRNGSAIYSNWSRHKRERKGVQRKNLLMGRKIQYFTQTKILFFSWYSDKNSFEASIFQQLLKIHLKIHLKHWYFNSCWWCPKDTSPKLKRKI